MLLSWKYKFVFIHIPKTGGTALSKALIPYARLQDRAAYGGISPLIRMTAAAAFGPADYVERIAGVKPHAGLAQIEDIFGADAVSPLLKVSFARNPFTRAYSLYAHVKRTPQHPHQKTIGGLSFRDAVPVMCEKNWTRQTPALRRRGEKNISVDFLGALERYEADASALAKLIGLPRPISLKHINVNPAPPPDLAEEFGDSVDAFVEANRLEFELLGYSADINHAGEPPLRPALLKQIA